MNSDVVVSIVVLTYNHEKYIQEALDSILMQKVDFTYEIIVGDDCSTDNTPSILNTYERKFPEVFKIINRDKNIGPTKNLYDVFMHCTGKYIAQLEGDDFWIDPYKLQKQVKFLEDNNTYIGVAHSCNVLCDDLVLKRRRELFYHCNEGNIVGFEDFKKKRFIGHTCTLVYKNIFLNPTYDYSILYKADYYTGDRTVNMLLVAQGYIYCMDSPMSVYRLIIKEGASNVNSLYSGKNKLLDDWNYEERLDEFCRDTFRKSFLTPDNLAQKWTIALVFFVRYNTTVNKKIFKEFSKIVRRNPSSILYIPKNIIKTFNGYITLKIKKLIKK